MKNTIIKGKVIDYTHDGKGIIKVDGYPLFVKDCILDELVEVKVLKWKKKYGYGKVIDIIDKSKYRINPDCPYYWQCGGCQLQIMDYERQLEFKKIKIYNAFKKQGVELDNIQIISNENQFYYRNKLSIPLCDDGNINVGLYRENSNDIIKIDKCLIQNDEINKIMIEIVALLNDKKVSIYDKIPHKGLLRQLVIRFAKESNELLIGFVVNKTNYNNELESVINGLSEYDNVKTIVINFNTEKNNVILGKENQIVYGSGYITDIIENKKFQISINSFYQVNTNQMINLYNKAISMANLNTNDIVFDAYCGIGTISLFIAENVKKVVGVDVVPSAIEDAKNNKRINNINNVEFICNDVQDYMRNQKAVFTTVFIDPPRKGCSQEFLDELIMMRSKKLVYIACDVATQARDIRYLLDNGYVITDYCGVDMFSQTYHIENIVSLEKIGD